MISGCTISSKYAVKHALGSNIDWVESKRLSSCPIGMKMLPHKLRARPGQIQVSTLYNMYLKTKLNESFDTDVVTVYPK